jgi:glycerol-3-phosphate dehydrogenase
LRLQVRKPGATDTKALSREHVVDIVDGHLLTIAGGRPCRPFPMGFCAQTQQWSQRVPWRATAYAQNRTGARRTSATRITHSATADKMRAHAINSSDSAPSGAAAVTAVCFAHAGKWTTYRKMAQVLAALNNSWQLATAPR